MPAMLKDSRFWWGAAAGFVLGPIVAKHVKMQVDRLKAKSA